MKLLLIIAALVLVVVSAAALAPVAEPLRLYLPEVTLALAIRDLDRGVPAASLKDASAACGRTGSLKARTARDEPCGG